MTKADDKTYLSRFGGLIDRKTGLRIRDQDSEQLMKAVQARKKANGCPSFEDYYRILDASVDEQKELKTLLTVGESYFFRDKGQFELLRNAILPDLIELRKKEKRLRVWSAGCSTGEEPYSLAILLDELLGGRGWNVHILGTDIRNDFLKKAAAGLYGKWSLRMVNEDTLKKYFENRGGEYQLDERVRKMVVFHQSDLFNDVYPDFNGELYDMDLIVCRNVFIYYGRNAVSEILAKLTDTLAENGYLMTGHGELFSVTNRRLKPQIYPESLVYRRVRPEEAPLREDIIAKDQLSACLTQAPATGLHERRQNEDMSRLQKPEQADAADDNGLSKASAFFDKGLYREAAEAAFETLTRNPRDYRALCIAAAAYANLGEHAKARDCLVRAANEDRSAAGPFYLLAHISEENGDKEEAKEAFKKAIYLDPSFVPAYIDLAAIYENEGATEKARRTRLAALSILSTFSADKKIEHYDGMTAGELASHVKKMAAGAPR